MFASSFPRPLIVSRARFSQEDRAVIARHRLPHTQLGFAYQLAFLRLTGRLPQQRPLEIAREVLRYVAVQIEIDAGHIERYAGRQPTISAHAEEVTEYLDYRPFSDKERRSLKAFLAEEVEHLEQPSALLQSAEQYLRQHHILLPATSTLKRIAHGVRATFRERLYRRLTDLLSEELKAKLDALLETPSEYPSEEGASSLQTLREAPGVASPRALKQEAQKLDWIEETGVQHVDLSWIRDSLQ